MAVFLRENGVLTMGNKTPVTILQETLQRRGLNPHYELIYNGVGTLDPVFKFQVTAAGFTAIGDGKSKKEAKHDAAASLLKRMHSQRAVTENSEVEASEEMEIASPYTGALKQNFVGMLDETCVINKLPLPAYVPIREEGPPHARIFTIQCKVSTVTETAVARTKKQAKHMAAQQMIGRIANILGSKYIPCADKPDSLDVDDPQEATNLKAIESGSFRHDLATIIADMHNVFYHRTEEFLVPKMFLDLPNEPEEFYEQLPEPKEFLDELVQGLEGTCKINFTSKESLKEAFEEMYKQCQMFWWGQEESSDEDEEVEPSSEDEDQSYLGQYPLEEFDLNSDEKPNPTIQVHQEPVEEGEPNVELCPNKLRDSDLSDLKNKDLDSGFNKEDRDSGDSPISASPFLLFLTLECPQGTWSFRGFGETEKEAVDLAAVLALQFLRVMAIPSESRKEIRDGDA